MGRVLFSHWPSVCLSVMFWFLLLISLNRLSEGSHYICGGGVGGGGGGGCKKHCSANLMVVWGKGRTSNEYPQHMYLSRNKKNMWILLLICSYVLCLKWVVSLYIS